MVTTQVMSHCNFEADKFNDFLYPVATQAKIEAESKFSFSIYWITEDQMNDTDFTATVNCFHKKGKKTFQLEKC